MILQNSFYTVTELSNDAGSLNAIISIDPGHPIFEGHFPGQPVVPGVCMVQVIKELLEQITAQRLMFNKGHQLKFLQLLVPVKEDAIQVHIAWKPEGQEYSVNAGFKKNNEAVFKLSGTFLVQ